MTYEDWAGWWFWYCAECGIDSLAFETQAEAQRGWEAHEALDLCPNAEGDA